MTLHLILTLTLGFFQVPTTPVADAPADRLLAAELLEISSGEIDRAMEVYRTLAADEKVPEAIRARALLYQARCHRKRGELETARQLLQQLVQKDVKEREILRQAQSYLRELQKGKAENPDFDWIGELERNPEIQARIFQYCMDLVSLDVNSQLSFKQLTALGTIAVPTVERLLAASRDPAHRQNLAMVLVYAGRYQHLETLLAADSLLSTGLLNKFIELSGRVLSLPPTEQSELFEVVARLPEGTYRSRYAAYLRLSGQRSENLAEDLEKGDGYFNYSSSNARRILDFYGRRPGAPAIYVTRLAESKSASARTQYLEALRSLAPARLTPEVQVGYARRASERDTQTLLFRLSNDGGFAALEALVQDPATVATAMDWYVQLSQRSLAALDARWAEVLVAAREWELLRILAEVNDGAIPVYVNFLGQRAALAPGFTGDRIGWVRTSRRASNWKPSRHAERHNQFKGDPNWVPSAPYRVAMVSLLDSADPVVIQIALNGLNAPGEVIAASTLPTLERILRKTQRSDTAFSVNQLLDAYAASGPDARNRVAQSDLQVVMNSEALTQTRLSVLEADRFDVSRMDWTSLLRSDDPLAARCMNCIPDDSFPGQAHPKVRSYFESLGRDEQKAMQTAGGESPQFGVRRWWLGSLKSSDPDFIANLDRELSLGDPQLRLNVASLALELRVVSALPLFERILAEVPEYRDSVIRAMGEMPSAETVVILRRLLDDPDAAVRTLAVNSLKMVDTLLREQNRLKQDPHKTPEGF